MDEPSPDVAALALKVRLLAIEYDTDDVAIEYVDALAIDAHQLARRSS